MSDQKSNQSASDRPPEDLKKERDAFIQQFFRKGAQLTEELVRENERLRQDLHRLESENAKLRAHLASDEAIRDLLRKIEKLEEEKEQLLQMSQRMDDQSSAFTDRYAEVENELAKLANLYVATSQLHAAHSVRNVLRNLKELLAQLLGAGEFAIFMVSDDGTELVALATEGVDPDEVGRISATEGPVGEAFQTGLLRHTGDGQSGSAATVTEGSMAAPAAVVPLTLDAKPFGAIAIFRTLSQKVAFGDEDVELFRLLSSQAARALVGARLFTDAGRKAPGLDKFVDLED